jgi:hypothetical protein
MKQLVLEVDLRGLRPYNALQGEALKRYQALKASFWEEESYELFAEVQESYQTQKVSWFTEIEGELIQMEALREISPFEYAQAKETLQYQVNRLFCKAMQFKNKEQVLAILENALEIPSLEYVYWVRHAEKPRCVLAGWGFVREGLLPEEHLLRNYTAYKVSELRFSFSYEGEDDSPAVGEIIYFEWDKETRKLTTDSVGKIALKGVPFYTLQRNEKTDQFEETRPNPIVKIYQIWQDNEKAFETEVQSGCFCEYPIKIKRPRLRATFTLRNKAKRSEILPNFVVAIHSKDEVWYKSTDSNGIITLADLPPKTELRIISKQEDLPEEEETRLIDFEQTKHDLYFTLPEKKIVPPPPDNVPPPLPTSADVEVGKGRRAKSWWWWLLLLPLLGALCWWWQSGQASQIPPPPIVPKPPTANCRIFVSGALIGESKKGMQGVSDVYVEDNYSEYVGSGEYSDNTKAFPKAVKSTFDGIAVAKGTRIIIYSKPNFEGTVLLDREGPLLLNNKKFEHSYKDFLTVTFKDDLQKLFPPNTREWSNADMHAWSYGSMKVICSEVKTQNVSEETPKVIPCNEQSKSGGTGITTNLHELGSKKGTVKVEYDMDDVADRISIYCGNEKLYDSNVPVRGKGVATVNPTCSTLKVVIEGGENTSWNYVVRCPE